MNFSIKDEKIVFKDHYKMVKANITYDTFDGKEIKTNRLAFERGDSVAILIFEKETESLLFTNQFRYPTCKNNEGWLLEIPAGSLEKNEKPENCIIREVMEEIGYRITSPKLISTFYTSPGASTERIFLFHTEVSEEDSVGPGGGVQNENEDIQLVKIPITEIWEIMDKLKDAKSILALQWFLLKQKLQ